MKMRETSKRPSGTPMDAALRYLGYRARTVRELERYLDEQQFGEYEISQVIERLKELGLADDTKFAADFIESRLRTKPVSRRHLQEQLYAHELPQEVIEEALSAVTDEMEQANATAVAEKYWRQFMALPDAKRAERVLQRLQGRGFSYGVSLQAVTMLSDAAEGDGA